MLYGDECIVRNEGIEIDPKELQPLGIAHGSVVWGICRKSPPHDPHYILSPIPPHAWGSSFKLAVRTFDRVGALQQLTEVLSTLSVNIVVYDSAPAGFMHCMVNLICELPFEFQNAIKEIRAESRVVAKTRDDRRKELVELRRSGSHVEFEQCEKDVAAKEARLRRLHAMAGGKNLLMGSAIGLIVRLVGSYLDPKALTDLSNVRKQAGLKPLADAGGLIELNRQDLGLPLIDVGKRIAWLLRDDRLKTCGQELGLLLNPLRTSDQFQHGQPGAIDVDRAACDIVRRMVEVEREDMRGYIDSRFLFAEGVFHEFRPDWNVYGDAARHDEGKFLKAILFKNPSDKVAVPLAEAVASWLECDRAQSRAIDPQEQLWDQLGMEWIWRQSRAVDNWISPTLLTCWFEDTPEETCAIFRYDGPSGMLRIVEDPRHHSHNGFWAAVDAMPFSATASISWRETFLRLTPLSVADFGDDRWCRVYITYKSLAQNGQSGTVGMLSSVLRVLMAAKLSVVRAESTLTDYPVGGPPMGIESSAITIVCRSETKTIDTDKLLKDLREIPDRSRFESWHPRVVDGKIRRLFISTRFTSAFWSDAERREKILAKCRELGFYPYYVQNELGDITARSFEGIRECECAIILLPLLPGEDIERAHLGWPIAEYAYARALGKPVARLVDCREGTVTIDAWHRAFGLDRGQVLFPFNSEHDLLGNALPTALDRLRTQLQSTSPRHPEC